MTALSVGMACTLVAALPGWRTGQHRQPVVEFNQAAVAAIAQPIIPIILFKNPPAESTASAQAQEPEESEIATTTATVVTRTPDATLNSAEVARSAVAVVSPVVMQLPTKSIQTRMLVRVVESAPTHELERLATLLDEESALVEFESTPIDTALITLDYAAPGAPVYTELQRHACFTD